MITIPAAGEFSKHLQTYVTDATHALAAMQSNDIVALLEAQPAALRAMLASAPASIVSHAYAPGKWTLGQSLVHVSDGERVFSYRLLRIARGDTTPLPGFEQDDYVPESRCTHRSLADVLNEFDTVRAATLTLVRSLDETALTRQGTASDNPVTARALVWAIAGHVAHHLTLTRERYLAPAG
jgi:hypothetical protein